MTRPGFILSELWRNFARTPLAVVGSILAVALLLLLFDLFWIGALSSKQFLGKMVTNVSMEAFVSEEVPDSAIGTLNDQIVNIPGLATFTYISRDSARAELARLVGTDLLVGYDQSNPLPRSFVLTIIDSLVTSDRLHEIDSILVASGKISDIYYNSDRIVRSEQVRVIIKRVGVVLGGLIFLSALLNLTNSIRLSTRTRAIGLRQMRLLGAGKIFLATPFLLEGFLLGGISSALGWGAVFYWKDQLPLGDISLLLPSIQQIVLYCVAVACLGLISGYLGVRKDIR
jgi:cell division transport system permease protein